MSKVPHEVIAALHQKVRESERRNLGAIIVVAGGIEWGRSYAEQGWRAYGPLGVLDGFVSDEELRRLDL